ncbi:MAG: hypothetical protein LBD02_03625 [Christensenellaceae bacterium]|jgi:hypothetical protein|nr:hypothetical protein [Christensenellaceae bacterium]
MHRRLQEYLTSRGFREEDGREKGILYGVVDDVYVTVMPSGCTGKISSFYFSMSCPVSTAADAIRGDLRALKVYRNLRVTQKGEFFTVVIANGGKALLPENLDWLFSTAVGSARQNNLVPNVHCVRCGKQTDEVALFNQAACPVCADCAAAIEQENQKGMGSPIFALTGLIGAVLGAAVGSIPWIIAYFNGWIVGMLAFLIGFCAFFGYRLFHGPKKRGAAITTVYLVSIGMILAVKVGLVITYLFMEGYIIDMETIAWVFSQGDMLRDLLISLGLGFAGMLGVNQHIAKYTVPHNARLIGRRAAPELVPSVDARAQAAPPAEL